MIYTFMSSDGLPVIRLTREILLVKFSLSQGLYWTSTRHAPMANIHVSAFLKFESCIIYYVFASSNSLQVAI